MIYLTYSLNSSLDFVVICHDERVNGYVRAHVRASHQPISAVLTSYSANHFVEIKFDKGCVDILPQNLLWRIYFCEILAAKISTYSCTSTCNCARSFFALSFHRWMAFFDVIACMTFLGVIACMTFFDVNKGMHDVLRCD